MQEFLSAQQYHIDKWLLNPQIYLMVALLLMATRFLPAEKEQSIPRANLATDYFYGVVYTLVLFPSYFVFFLAVEGVLNRWFPWFNLGLSQYLPAWLQVLIAIFINDFLAYVSHYCRHRYRFLWHFHAVHHSQERMNPLTTKRTHPVERVFTRLFIFWLPLAIMGSPAELWAIFVLVDAAWDYFIHSNLRINLGPLGKVLVSPQYHRIHHSSLPQHADKNLADRFVIWDRLFGTFYPRQDEYPPVGLHQTDGFPLERSWLPWKIVGCYLSQMWHPFRMVYRDLAEAFSGVEQRR